MNYRQSINLMLLRGAQLCSATINGQKVNVVMIPVQENHISVTVDPQTRQPKDAYLSIIADEPGNAYYEKVLRENPKANLPSHMLYNNPLPDSRKRLDALMEQKLRNTPEYMATNPTDEEIAKRARYDVRRSLYLGRAYSFGQQNEFRGTAPQAETSAYQPTGQESSLQQSAQQDATQSLHQGNDQAHQQSLWPEPQGGQPIQSLSSNVNPGDDLPF